MSSIASGLCVSGQPPSRWLSGERRQRKVLSTSTMAVSLLGCTGTQEESQKETGLQDGETVKTRLSAQIYWQPSGVGLTTYIAHILLSALHTDPVQRCATVTLL